MSAGNGTSFGRGRKPVVTAADDPLKLVMSSFELPVGLREAAKIKAKRLSKSGDLPKMDSISAYLRGCLVDFVAAPEPVVKNQVWRTIGKRLKAGTPDEIAKFLEKQQSEATIEVEANDSENIKTPVEHLLNTEPEVQSLAAESQSEPIVESEVEPEEETSNASPTVPRYDFGDWLD